MTPVRAAQGSNTKNVMGNKPSFKSDIFKKNRGGYSRWLLLACENCDTELMVYQKDGPGVLKRLYKDRIRALDQLKSENNLECNNCGAVLGIPMIYKKEDRPAFRLFAGAITKKIIKNEDVPGIVLD